MIERIKARFGAEITARMSATLEHRLNILLHSYARRSGLTETEVRRLAIDILMRRHYG